MLSPTVLGVIICVTAAILEGAPVGTGARQRLAQLQCHLFPTIRTLACDRFPVLCDVLRQFAPCARALGLCRPHRCLRWC